MSIGITDLTKEVPTVQAIRDWEQQEWKISY